MVWPVTTGPGSSRAITRRPVVGGLAEAAGLLERKRPGPVQVERGRLQAKDVRLGIQDRVELAEASAEPGDAGVEAALFHVEVAPVDEQVAPAGHVFGHAGPGGQGLLQHRFRIAIVDLGPGGVLRRRVRPAPG